MIVVAGGALVAVAAAIAAPVLAATVDVAVGNYYFEDSTVGDGVVTARQGDQLRFSFVEGAGHTVTISALGIDSGQLPIGATYVTPALNTPGTYSLICTTHRLRNHATTLVVVAGGGSTTTNPPPTTRPSTTTSTSTSTPTSTPSTTNPGASATTVTPLGGSVVPGDADSGGGQDAGAAEGDDLLPVGVTGGDGKPWLRAVWVALGTLPFFAAAAALAEWAARRRPDSGARPASD
jgi:plastocyanin